MSRRRDSPLGIGLRVTLAVVGVVVGAVLVVGTAMLGACDAFGGTCPSSPGLHGDVYGGIAFGLLLVVAAPLAAYRPDRRGLVVAALVAAPVAAMGAFVLGRAALT